MLILAVNFEFQIESIFKYLIQTNEHYTYCFYKTTQFSLSVGNNVLARHTYLLGKLRNTVGPDNWYLCVCLCVWLCVWLAGGVIY